MKNLYPLFILLVWSCQTRTNEPAPPVVTQDKLKPVFITDTLPHDTDDPAIWIHPEDPGKSLVLGTDKEKNGGVYAFNLQGQIVHKISPVQRPNNVDVEYGLSLGDSLVDIAVFTERLEEKIRVVSLPDMKYIDNGGIPVFQQEPSEDFRAPMGIALYKNAEGRISAFVSRKDGPTDGTYVWQYILEERDGFVTGQLVRKLGSFSGKGEIEALVVDDQKGFIFYSDEAFGIRKYHAHADSTADELLTFGHTEFKEDREGLALATRNGKSFLIVSDQQDHSFEIFSGREDNGEHRSLGNVRLSTIETDGCEVYSDSLSPDFPEGLFVAMSEGKVFHYYRLDHVLESLESKESMNSQ